MSPNPSSGDNGGVEDKTMTTRENRQSRIALIAVAAVVVVAIVVAAVLGVLRDVAQLDPDSPEGVVQSYVMAVFDQDEPAARSFLTANLEATCRRGDFPRFETSAARVELDDATITGDEARVEVTIHESTDLLEEWQHTEVFYLTDTADGWRISEAPGPLYGC